MGDFNFNFEFVGSGAPIVTLSGLGIAFNPLSRSLLSYPDFINIGFDENKLAIGVKSHDVNSQIKSYEFEKKEKNGWVRIGCKDFVKYLSKISEIDFISKAQQFFASYDENEKMLIIVVDKEHIKN